MEWEPGLYQNRIFDNKEATNGKKIISRGHKHKEIRKKIK